MTFGEFEKDLRDGPEFYESLTPFGSTREELVGWYHSHSISNTSAATEHLFGHLRDGEQPKRNPFRDVGRNDPCPCGSGKKFKKCCYGIDPDELMQRLAS
jgi:hypothetical protein